MCKITAPAMKKEEVKVKELDDDDQDMLNYLGILLTKS